MTIVFKPSKNVLTLINKYFEDYAKTKIPYSVFQVTENDTIVTLYESGKIMFQGKNADLDASLWIGYEMELNNRDIYSELEKKEKDKKDKTEDVNFNHLSTVGSDEVGTGDLFGPIVVTASFVDKAKASHLKQLGVQDSKAINDQKIMEIAPTLIKEIPHVTYVVKNEQYNSFYQEYNNLNQIKAILHNKCIYQLINEQKPIYDKIVIDQFCYPTKYFEHIKKSSNIVRNITFTTHAENKCLSVAASSIISRYIFLNEMDKLSKEIGFELAKGAGSLANEQLKTIIDKKGFNYLPKIAKLNFKNISNLKEN